MNPSPFGRYAEILATLVAVGSILAAVMGHLFVMIRPELRPDTFLDNIALLAFGAVFAGQASKNGAARIAVSAHQRLDEIGAPPANDGHPPAAAPA